MGWVKYVAKALVAGVVAFASGLIAALSALPGTDPNPGDLGWVPWLTIIVATVGAVGAVFGISNGPSPNAVKARAQQLKQEIDLDAEARQAVGLPPAPSTSAVTSRLDLVEQALGALATKIA